MKIPTKTKIGIILRTCAKEGILSGSNLARSFFFNHTVMMSPDGATDQCRVRGNTSDAIVYHATFVAKDYKGSSADSFGLILDLGANVGYSAIYFSSQYPEAKVIALEPHSGNFEDLCTNTEPYSNIVNKNQGIWWRKSRLTVIDPDKESWGFQFKEEGDGAVECTTISDLIAEHGDGKPVMVKMDIEGAEKYLFQKDPSWVKQISMLQIEIHDCWKEIFDALIPYDYTAEISGKNVIFRFH